MVMALRIFHDGSALIVVAGYENGRAIVASLDAQGNAIVRYQAQPHTQPILSLDVAPDKTYFLTSSADAIIARHPLPKIDEETPHAASGRVLVNILLSNVCQTRQALEFALGGRLRRHKSRNLNLGSSRSYLDGHQIGNDICPRSHRFCMF